MLLLRGATRCRARGCSMRNRFNTCSSCEEQLYRFGFSPVSTEFQYMLLLRGATFVREQHSGDILVSIHAPLARSNVWGTCWMKAGRCFNTCSSCEEQQFVLPGGYTREEFQYMLLLRGATFKPVFALFPPSCFNTCSSCEEQRAPADGTER